MASVVGGIEGYSSIVSLCLNLRLARSAALKQNWLPKSSNSIRGKSRTVCVACSPDVMFPDAPATSRVDVEVFEARTGVGGDFVA